MSDSSPEQGAFTKVDVEKAMTVAFETHGYATEEESRPKRDLNAIAAAAFVPVSDAIAHRLNDRHLVFVTRGTLMATTFPGVAGPNEWDEQDDPAFAKAVHTGLDKVVWGQSQIDPNGRMWKLAERDGYVLCRTKLAPKDQKDVVEGVYITRDEACVWTDLVAGAHQSMSNALLNGARKVAAVGMILPTMAEALDTEYKKDMRQALTQGEQAFLPALRAAQDVDEEQAA